MSLSNKHKSIILKKYRKLPAKKISEELNLDVQEVQNYLNEINKKPPFYFYILLIIMPILFLISLEIGLRLFNYGRNLDAFITISDEFPDLLYLNPDLPFRYVSNLSTPPATVLDGFKKEKPDSTFRIFVMGGSSTAGWPYAYNATFPRYIQRKLALLYPEYNIEVINLGITAHNSYTIADLAEDVAVQKPDLVLVYAGHNEYYGALGVASTESYGSSMFLSKLMIELRQIKIFQLMNNFINYLTAAFTAKAEVDKDETLMSRMIGDDKILYNSDTYKNGIEQFQENMSSFLEVMKQNSINVIIGNLVCNYYQKPFVSVSGQGQKNADSIFISAKEKLLAGEIENSQKLFFEAKEYDALRFRAPGKMNSVINELAQKYNLSFIDLASVFQSKSSHGIIGYNLMVDHLHPNLEGYDLIGKAFYKVMEEKNFLPESKKYSFSETELDSIMKSNFPYTQLDSVISDLRIRRLLGSYPFVPKNEPNQLALDFIPTSFEDSLAIRVMRKEISWRLAHQEAAQYYYAQKQFVKFIKEMDAVIADQPYGEIAYAFIASGLVNAGLYSDALKYLFKLHELNPNDYTYKWLGSIALVNKKYNIAINYLKKSIELNNKDAQTYYNLSGAYFNVGNINDAVKSVERCLSLNGNYPQAKNFYQALLNIKPSK
ncbi:MAG: hypothetical protein A2068_12440 [Ignavibacteria bacterium GWB2_35_6b]|nr:MAG: hypothetical protein A2068_12440 [Ignavibacteria bacterium GWB2_35_6b]